MSDGATLSSEDLPEEIAAAAGVTGISIGGASPDASGPMSFKELVKRQTQSVERDLIEKALEETNGNVTRAAEKLGLSRKGLQLKIKELGLRR
jgi:DNA-binding NtrC family response regulator